jgi:hypothetical protein
LITQKISIERKKRKKERKKERNKERKNERKKRKSSIKKVDTWFKFENPQKI